jgi:hypothetical protein
MPFWPELLATIVGALVGVTFGVPAALAIDRLVRRSALQRERILLRDSLLGAIERNMTLFNEYDSEELLGYPPHSESYTPSDRSLLDATAYRKWEVLGSPRAREAIDEARFGLLILDSTLERLHHVALQPDTDPAKVNRVKAGELSAMETVGLALQDLTRAHDELLKVK